MKKYKYREGSYGYEEPIGFESIRSMIEDEISSNKKTDEQQSEDIAQEGQERQTADEQIEERISALEEAVASGSSSDVEESFNEFTGTTYPADKEALEAKDAELEAAIADKADSADVEAVQAAIDTLNGDGEGSVKKAAEDAAVAEVAKVVAEAPEDFDTLKEVADYIAADKTKASEIEAKLSEHDAAVEELGAKDEELAAKDEELAAKDAELEAAIAEKADASAVEALEATVAEKADNDALEAEIARAMAKEGELQASIAEKATNTDLTAEVERAQAAEQELESKLDAKADASTVADEFTGLKNKDTELEAKDAAQDEEIAKKVEWVESTPGRNHIVLKNHDSILGTATDGTTYNLAMVSKWDVADFGTAQLHANLNSKDGIVTINDDKAVATKDEVEAVETKVDAIDLAPYAKSEEVNAELANKANASDLRALNTTVEELSGKVEEKALQSDLEAFEASSTEALNAEVARAEAKEAALETKDAELNTSIIDEATRATAAESELEGKITAEQARAEAKEAELAAKDETQDAEIAKKVDWVESTPGRNHIVLKNHDSLLGTATDGTTYNVAMVSKWDVADFGTTNLHLNLNTSDAVTINDNKVVATEDVVDEKIAAIQIPSVEGLAAESAVTAEEEARVAGDEALQESINEVDAKVEAIVVPDVSGFAVKSEVTEEINAEAAARADGDAALTAAIAAIVVPSIDGLASEEYVDEQIEKVVGAAPENFDTLEEFADALADLKVVDVPAQPGEHYTQEEIDEAQPGDDAYGKTTDDWKVEPVEEESHNMTITEFVETVNEKPQIEALTRKYEALLTLLNLSDADVNSVIVNEALVDSNNVVFDEGPVNNIVVPETTKSKTVTAELDPDTDLTLTSRYSVTINNTSEEPTDLTVTAPAVSGYNAATITLNDGEFDTVTLTDASLTVNTGASVQNVVITQETTKNLTINAMFAEGATITSESSAAITLTNKNPEGEEVSVVLDAPGATVTMSGGKWVNVEAAVSSDTLIINSNAHIENLTVTQGNVLVKVARQSDIESVIKNYTLAPGSSIDYLHDEISASNVSNLATTGTHTLVEDITKSGRFAPGIFASDNMVWNLNGHNITFTNTQGYANFLLRGSLQLEINGEGNVVNSAGDYGFWAAAEGVKVVVNGGHFEAATHVLYAEKGTIEVNGGSFKLTNPDECDKDVNGNFKFLLNCKDENYTAGTAKIIVRGGKFYGFNPAVTYGEPSGPVSYVAPGYHAVESTEDGMKVYTVVADE